MPAEVTRGNAEDTKHVRVALDLLREHMLVKLEEALTDPYLLAAMAEHNVGIINPRRGDGGVQWELVDLLNRKQVSYVERMGFASYLGSVKDLL